MTTFQSHVDQTLLKDRILMTLSTRRPAQKPSGHDGELVTRAMVSWVPVPLKPRIQCVEAQCPHIGDKLPSLLFDPVSKSQRVISDADCCAVGPGTNPGEDMDVCKRIVPSRHGGSYRAANPLMRLVEEGERLALLKTTISVLPLNFGGAKSCCHLYGVQSYG
ncbi:hypothetical protein TNCV_5062881 [Trichonephila clavipes]|nr:hypothetical protein TNCV_5062881 [Trichonephila clavipes]